MAKHKFDVSSVFDVVEVGEHSFTVDMSDAKIRDFRVMIAKYGKEFTELSKIDAESLSDEEAEQLEGQARDLLKTVIDSILEDGAFQKVHETLGRSTYNVAAFADYLFGLIDAKFGEQKQKKAQDYLQKAAK